MLSECLSDWVMWYSHRRVEPERDFGDRSRSCPLNRWCSPLSISGSLTRPLAANCFGAEAGQDLGSLVSSHMLTLNGSATLPSQSSDTHFSHFSLKTRIWQVGWLLKEQYLKLSWEDVIELPGLTWLIHFTWRKWCQARGPCFWRTPLKTCFLETRLKQEVCNF